MAMHHRERSESERKVAIIGAGISGLAAAKELARFNPMVFEATNFIGGVWKHCSYRSTKLQTPRVDYEFSDYPWKKDREDTSFPTHDEILEYLAGYATYFDLWKNINFRSKVVEIRFIGTSNTTSAGHYSFSGQPVWEIAVQNQLSQTIKWYKFEFVVICLGKYGDVANIPAFPQGRGPEVFTGKVMHSMDYCKLEKEEARRLVKGKKIVVVGYKKSAIDLAMECADANHCEEGKHKSCTMIVRSLHWVVPSYSIWGLPFFLFYSTRFSQFLHLTPNQGLVRSVLSHLSSPFRRGVSKFIESYLTWKLPLEKYGLKPDHPFVEDYASCQMAILPNDFFREADDGRILFKKLPTGRNWSFYENGVLLDDNTKLEADVVFFATGFNGKGKLKSILPDPFRDIIVDSSSGLIPLYRGTIHPLIPQMAFVGYIESVSNLHTSELRCKWLSRLLDERFKLPTVEEMMANTREETEVMRKTTRFYKRHCISTYSINHSDDMCKDMGWNTRRKKGWFSEMFSPYNNEDYKKDEKDEL